MSEGIQQGHMSLQYKSLAIVVGAKGDEIAKVAEALKQEPVQIHKQRNVFYKKLDNNSKLRIAVLKKSLSQSIVALK